MEFLTLFPRFPILLMAVTVLNVNFVSTNECPSSNGKIECICTATTVECFGIQTNLSEIQDILANSSFASNIILKIDDLEFEPSFIFENSSIKNLTLGYGLEIQSPNIFSGLKSSLISLNLQNNSIKEIDDLFSDLILLTELFLDMNGVYDLKQSAFINLVKLNYLSITRNNIHKVDPDVFQNLLSLQTLELSHNNLSLLENINMKSTSMKVLKIDNCLIEGLLPKDTFSYMPNLEQLDLSYNRLSAVEQQSLSSLKSLKFLNLSHNIITNLNENAFSEITSMTFLDLRDNQIIVLKETAFAKLQNLRYLDLSGNKLSSVLCEYTTDFASLEEIYLQDNGIKSFSYGAFYYSPKLRVLDLTGNKLECSCQLTDSAHYLINHSSIEQNDFDSIFCITPSMPSPILITDYKNPHCPEPEPCKDPLDDYEDYDDEDSSLTSSTTYLTTGKTTTEDSTITYATNSTDNIVYDITESTTFHNVAEISTALTEMSTAFSNVTEISTASTDISTASTDISTASTETSTALSDIESTTFQQSTLREENVSNSTRYLDVTTTSQTDLFNLTTLTTISIKADNNSEVSSTIFNENTTSTIPSMTKSTSKRINTTMISEGITSVIPISPCSSLSLSVGNISSESELIILKNFSYDGNNFCVKWTVGNIHKGIKRCVMKYSFINGTKSENLKCPKSENEIQKWSKIENIYKFCINIYSYKKIDSCALVPQKTVPSLTTYLTTQVTTINTETESFSQTSTKKISPEDTVPMTDNPLTESLFTLTESFTATIKTTSLLSSENAVDTSESSSIPSTEAFVTTKPSVFSLTTLNVYFNDSQLAFITWTVNKEVPFPTCNLTLTATTQYFDHNEGTFSCKNNTHRLQNVKENDIFKICILSQHEISGTDVMCSHSLYTAKASKTTENSLNGSMVPLICLLVLLGIIIACLIFKNVFKKKKETNKYDVRAEEEKYEQRVRLRSSSSDNQSVRFSYIAKEKNEII